MNDGKKPPRPEPADELIELDELPPMDDDLVAEADPEELAGYLSGFEDEPDAPGAEEPTGEEQEQERLAAELVEIEEGSWVDEGAEVPEPGFELEVDDAEEGWTDSGADEALGLDEQWFVAEDAEPIVDDGGAEGPIDDGELEIDRDAWEELGGPEEDEDTPLDEVLGQLGISLPGSVADDDTAALEVDSTLVADHAFLGPQVGRVAALAVGGGGPPVVVGDAIFVVGADGMLHRAAVPTKWYGTSICIQRDLVFIGTTAAGAFAFDRRSQGILPINSWCDLGIGGGEPGGRVTTSFQVRGQISAGGFRLLGRTGAGQLFASEDLGSSWRGPLTNARCLAVAPVGGSGATLVLVDSRRGPRLKRSEDLEQWDEVPLPEQLAPVVGGAPLHLAGSSATIVVAVEDRTVPLFVTHDGGASWRSCEQLRGATAVIVDPEDPGWIAAALHREVRDLGVVRVSDDGGRSWKTALVTGRERAGTSDDDEQRGQVTELALASGAGRILYVLAGEGVHRVELARRRLSH